MLLFVTLPPGYYFAQRLGVYLCMYVGWLVILILCASEKKYIMCHGIFKFIYTEEGQRQRHANLCGSSS